LKFKIKVFDIFNKPTVTIPSLLRAIIYLLQIPILLYLMTHHIFENKVLQLFHLQFFVFFFGLIFGLKDLKPYFKTINSWGNTFKITLYLLFSELVLIAVYASFFGEDPQGIATVAVPLKLYALEIVRLPFIAFGEEFFKVLVFLALLSLIKSPWKIRLSLAILGASFFFGFAHVFGYKMTAGLPIMIMAIPSFIFLMYFRSIYPLIFSHFIWDGLNLSFRLETYGTLFEGLLKLIIMLVVIIQCFRTAKKDYQPRQRTLLSLARNRFRK
jgi:hypothetical protein